MKREKLLVESLAPDGEMPSTAEALEQVGELCLDVMFCVLHSAQIFSRTEPEVAYRLAWMPSGQDGYIAAEWENKPVAVRFLDRTAKELSEELAVDVSTINRATAALRLARLARLEHESRPDAPPDHLI